MQQQVVKKMLSMITIQIAVFTTGYLAKAPNLTESASNLFYNEYIRILNSFQYFTRSNV